MVVWDTPRYGGPGERLLLKMMRTAAFPPDSFYVTSLVKCRPDGRTPRAAEVASCKLWLREEVRACRPRVIVTLGSPPAKVLLRGDSKFRLEEVLGKPQKVDYLKDGIVVPLASAESLLGGGMKKVEEAVRTLVKCRNYAGIPEAL